MTVVKDVTIDQGGQVEQIARPAGGTPGTPSPTTSVTREDRPGWQTIPWTWFGDPAVEQVEQRELFRRSWQYFCPTEQLGTPGDFVAGEHGKVPVVVVRGQDGVLRAFLNVCRHRGTRVCVGTGNRNSLQCPYHAWTYALDGSLRSAPRSGREPGFDPSGLGLVPVAVDTFGPMVFVNPSPTPEPATLAEALGSLPDLVERAGVGIEALRFFKRTPYEIAANWKVVIENYLECYHCQINHPGLAAVVDVGPDSYEVAVDGPVLSGWTPLRDRRRAEPYELEGEVTGGSYFLVLPSMTVDIAPGRANLAISTVFPDGPRKTFGVTDSFYAEGVTRDLAEAMMAFDAQVGAEDQALVEAAQIGLDNGILDSGRLLLGSERLIASFEHYVRDACEAHLT